MNTNTVVNITTVESLVAEARRRGFKIKGGFMPKNLIPLVEAAIADQNKRDHGFSETSGDYLEWKQDMDNLQEFLALLKTLPDRLPYQSATPGTAKLQLGAITGPTTPASPLQKQKEPSNIKPKNAREDDAADPDSLIKKVEKYLAENDKKPHAPQKQQLPPNPTPSNDPSDPRRTPVDNPSIDASDASTDASFDGPFTGIFAGQANPAVRAQIERERTAYLAQLLRETTSGKSPIDDLSPERQQSLYQLIQDGVPLTAIVRLIAAPEPQGWNFKTCDNSLRRFKNRYRKKLEAAELAHAITEARDTIQQTGADEKTYTDATRRLLKIRLYRNAADPTASPEKIEHLVRLLDRQRRTDLAERRVQVLENRAQQNE